MSKDFSRKFYSSQAWNNCRTSYMQHVHHLCERCLANGIMKPAAIVHHKIELTPDNIDDPNITLGFDNLEAVCRECHGKIHDLYQRKRRYLIMDDGSVVSREISEKK